MGSNEAFLEAAMLDQNTVEEGINEACAYLYEREKELIRDQVHERTIVADVIAPYLRAKFTGWNVNTEFNREGENRDPKKDSEGRLLLPDIIVHKQGPNGPNVAAIQVKGYWNREDRKRDENSLRRIQARHGYPLL